MADYTSARAKGIAAVDELDAWQSQPTLSSQLAAAATLQQQVTTLTADLSTRTGERDAAVTSKQNAEAAITDMKAAAQAEVTADAATVTGKAILDAAAAKGY